MTSPPLLDSSTTPGRRKRLVPILIPVLVLAAWFLYMWAVSGIITKVEKYPDGNVKAEGYLKRVGLGEYRPHGHWVTYHENGKKASDGYFDLGEKTGDWTHLKDDGSVERIEHFRKSQGQGN